MQAGGREYINVSCRGNPLHLLSLRNLIILGSQAGGRAGSLEDKKALLQRQLLLIYNFFFSDCNDVRL